MGKANDGYKLVKETLDEIEAHDSYEGPLNHNDPAQSALKWLTYIHAFLMWHSNMEDMQEPVSYVALLDQKDVEGEAFKMLPGNLGMGVNAVVSAGDTLESVLEQLPRRLTSVRCLLDRPVRTDRQKALDSLGMTPI
jgi:hypothetical protein